MRNRILPSALAILFLFILADSSAQDRDLIVTVMGDSIVCSIDSISNTRLFYSRMIQDDRVQNYISMEEVLDYRKTIITRKEFQPETETQSYTDSCGFVDIDNCSLEEFNCLWDMATETVNKGARRTVLGVLGIGIAFFRTRAAMAGNAGGAGNAILVIASGAAGIFGIISGPAKLSEGSKQKSLLKTNPHYKSLSIRDVKITPAIYKNQLNSSYAFGLTASLKF